MESPRGATIFWRSKESGLFTIFAIGRKTRENGIFARSNDFLANQGKWTFRDFRDFLGDEGERKFHEEQRFSGEPRKVDFSRFPRIGSGEWKQPRPLTSDTYADTHGAKWTPTKQVWRFAFVVSSRFLCLRIDFFQFFVLLRRRGRVFGERGEKEVFDPFGRRGFASLR